MLEWWLMKTQTAQPLSRVWGYRRSCTLAIFLYLELFPKDLIRYHGRKGFGWYDNLIVVRIEICTAELKDAFETTFGVICSAGNLLLLTRYEDKFSLFLDFCMFFLCMFLLCLFFFVCLSSCLGCLKLFAVPTIFDGWQKARTPRECRAHSFTPPII